MAAGWGGIVMHPLPAVVLTGLAIPPGILALVHWREIVTFIPAAGAACLAWRLEWLLPSVLGLGWSLRGNNCDV